jgi:hypothetical protein
MQSGFSLGHRLRENVGGLSDKNINTDITKNPNGPACDVYFAGFPCQSYSDQGRGEGLQSENGNVGLACIRYLMEKKPKVVTKPVCNNPKGWFDFIKSAEVRCPLKQLRHSTSF